MRTRRLRRILPTALLAGLLVVPLAACSGGDAIPDDQQQTTDDQPAPPNPGDEEGETGDQLEGTEQEQSAAPRALA
jgi:hypothetical protein